MRELKNYNFKARNIVKDSINGLLKVENENDELINFETFILSNPITENEFPEFDKPFFNRMDATLKHILHCYTEGWINSERQIFYTSNECLTTIQFVFRRNKLVVNCFQRSSNLKNLKEDAQFLNWFIMNNFSEWPFELNIMVSMPHYFKNKTTKVG